MAQENNYLRRSNELSHFLRLSIYNHVFTSLGVQNKPLLLENTNNLTNHIIHLHRIQYFTEQERMV